MDDSLLPGADELFEHAPCGLVVTAEDGTLLRCNQTFCNWLGMTRESLAGRRFQELLTMGGRIFHQTHWAPLMKMQGSVAEVKLDLRHGAGHLVTVLLNGTRRELAHGVVYELALFGTVDRDRYERELLGARRRAEELLSEKTAAETALQQAQTELAEAYRNARRRASFAEQMVAIASHDLKNPLTAIRMAAELLGQADRGPRDNRLLSHIGNSCARAERMIADLLDLASVRSGKGLGIKRRQMDLHQVVEQSVNELRVAFPQAHLRYLCKGSGQVAIDLDRAQQMIGNLVANGVNYGDRRHPLTITSELTADAAVLAVHNHGPAIPASLIPVLFEPMTRASEHSDTVRSVGLGLFIVREIASAHGGTVDVDSDEPRGTCFVIRLPRSAATATG